MRGVADEETREEGASASASARPRSLIVSSNNSRLVADVVLLGNRSRHCAPVGKGSRATQLRAGRAAMPPIVAGLFR